MNIIVFSDHNNEIKTVPRLNRRLQELSKLRISINNIKSTTLFKVNTEIENRNKL